MFTFGGGGPSIYVGKFVVFVSIGTEKARE